MGSGFLPEHFGGTAVRLHFGDCTLDADTREISRRGKIVHVEPKAYRLLELLLEARPKALSKNALQEALWPETYVSELALSRLVSVLRGALGDGKTDSPLIRTVHGFGYAFSGEVKPDSAVGRRAAASSFHCRLVMGDNQIALAEGENVIGRDLNVTVWIDKASVSRRHARIVVAGGQATVEDLDSRNGTCVNGKRIESPTRLSSGDAIKVGVTTMTFRSSRGLGTTESEISSHAVEPGDRSR